MKLSLLSLVLVASAHAAQVEGTNVIADVVERATPAVVDIQADLPAQPSMNAIFFGLPQRSSRSVGAGVIFDARGYVLTNEHVVHGATTALVTLPGGKRLKAAVRGADFEHDIAVLELAGPNLTAKDVAKLSTGRVRVGDWVVAIGSPFHLQTSVSKGIISGLGRDLNIGGRAYKGLLQTDAVMNPGNSGGPLFDMKGEVVGIATATTRGNAIGFAIPIATAFDVAKKLLAGPPPRPQARAPVQPHVHFGQPHTHYQLFPRGRTYTLLPRTQQSTRTFAAPRASADLGLKVRAVSRKETQALPAQFQKGVVVSQVTSGSLGESIGLKPGDVIGWLNGETVDSTATYDRQRKQTVETHRLAIRVWRNGTFLMLQLSL